VLLQVGLQVRSGIYDDAGARGLRRCDGRNRQPLGESPDRFALVVATEHRVDVRRQRRRAVAEQLLRHLQRDAGAGQVRRERDAQTVEVDDPPGVVDVGNVRFNEITPKRRRRPPVLRDAEDPRRRQSLRDEHSERLCGVLPQR
jgi:hypothetical protein